MTPAPPSTDPPDIEELEKQWALLSAAHDHRLPAHADSCPRCNALCWLDDHEAVFMPWLLREAREAERLRAEREAFRAALINSLAISPSWSRVGAQAFVDACHTQAKGLSRRRCPKGPEVKTIEDVDYAETQLGFAQDEFLRKNGWTHTSSTPGAFWLWTRMWKRRTIMVSRDIALAMCRAEFGPWMDSRDE